MPLTLERKKLSFKDIKLLDLVMTGDASRMAGCDRRTFRAWAKKEKVFPIAAIGEPGTKNYRELYRRKDAEKVARAYKASIKTSTPS